MYGKTEVASLGLIPPAGGRSDMSFIRGAVAFENRAAARRPGRSGRRPRRSERQGLPLMKPPYGAITAIDMDKGEILWQIAHGETPDNIRNNPALKG